MTDLLLEPGFRRGAGGCGTYRLENFAPVGRAESGRGVTNYPGGPTPAANVRLSTAHAPIAAAPSADACRRAAHRADEDWGRR
jgi:hypothetical protein